MNDFEIVSSNEVFKCRPEFRHICSAIETLKDMDIKYGVKIELSGLKPLDVLKKAHRYAALKGFKIRTRTHGGYLFAAKVQRFPAMTGYRTVSAEIVHPIPTTKEKRSLLQN